MIPSSLSLGMWPTGRPSCEGVTFKSHDGTAWVGRRRPVAASPLRLQGNATASGCWSGLSDAVHATT